MAQKISRAEEAKIPAFKDHVEAKEWFRNKYSMDFVYQSTDHVGDEKCYFYALVHDWEAYTTGQRQLQQEGYTQGFDFINSYQLVEIMESGAVHIVH